MRAVSQTDYSTRIGSDAAEKRISALQQAYENRKFEIELYWKRATYFWAFIAAAFGGYFALQANSKDALPYLVACLGFMFSLAWYFVNRGSKAWQQNWEMHVDLLENENSGPIYKTILSPREYRLRDVTDAFPFSVSKINQVLSLFVTIVWVVLAVRSLCIAKNSASDWTLIVAMTLVTLGGIIMLFCAKTGRQKIDAEIFLDERKYR